MTLIDELRTNAAELAGAIESASDSKQAALDAGSIYDVELARHLLNAERDAADKLGPLAGLAKTSHGYKSAVLLLERGLQTGELATAWQNKQATSENARAACIRLDQLRYQQRALIAIAGMSAV